MPRAELENSTLLPGSELGSSIGKSMVSSRRAVLAAGLALSVAAAVPACAASDPDAELVALADRIKCLHPSIVEAYKRLDEAGERYQAIKPDRSQALVWRPTDAGFVDRYRNTPHCTDQSIDALRGQKFVEWDFTGTSEELEQLDPRYLGSSVLPVPGHEHRFVSRLDEWRHRRATELIAALDEYRAKNVAAIEQSGCTPAENALEALLSERNEITDRMLELKPAGLRGLQALATGLVYAEWSGDIGNRPNESTEDEMITAIIRALASDASGAGRP